tara:strand:- start:557 stop:682 length:126 start_codon:yes stop_codon:yes gene_type:complete
VGEAFDKMKPVAPEENVRVNREAMPERIIDAFMTVERILKP